MTTDLPFSTIWMVASSVRWISSAISVIYAVAICLNDNELKQMSWSTFVAGCGQYPELVQCLKERRICINEPVTAEVEV